MSFAAVWIAGAQVAPEEGERRWADPGPGQIAVAGVGEFRVLHLDPGRAEDGHQPPRLRDWDHVVQGAVDDQERGGPGVDPGERRRIAVALGHLCRRPAQEGNDLV